MTTQTQRLAQRLNQALRTLLGRYDDLYLIGEDIADPYGGAFGVTRGLSSRYPDRVFSAPISENGIIGVANGLALRGDQVIAEIMFGDFIALALDQILNVAAKSVTMYGRRLPMRLVIRCPVGGHRGYGPTHSQSPQKHLIGIPNLSLYELSPFHDPELLLESALRAGEPAVIFEPKTMYGQRTFGDGRVDDLLRYEFADPGRNWAHVHLADQKGGHGRPEVAVLAPGGTSAAAIEAARALAADDGVRISVIVPARLYPVDIDPIIDLLSSAAVVCVAEESTTGGTWGTEVARHIHERLWGVLPRPAVLLSSRDSIIPTAPHLERKVLLQMTDIRDALRAALHDRSALPGRPPALPERPAMPHQAGSTPITVPKLNSNDVSYILLSWLAQDGQRVAEGQPIAEIDTSKAVQELAATADGVLRHAVPDGAECRPGDQIGELFAAAGTQAGPVPATRAEEQANRLPATRADEQATPSPAVQAETLAAASPSASPSAGLTELARSQQLVAEVVTTARREIPDAFVVRRVRLDAVADLESALDEQGAEPVGLLDLLVKIVGDLRASFPLCFASLADQRRVCLADAAHVGVTFDAGNGLFIPVVRAVEHRRVAQIADELAGYRLRAVRATFTPEQLSGANIVISWNHDREVVLVQPIILPGLACVISVGGPLSEVRLDGSGRPVGGTVAHLGLAHDHRIVNGRDAVAFLDALATAIEDRELLDKLVAS